MFKIEISEDRSPDRRRPDPVVARVGVFAELEAAELSPAEIARPVEIAAAEAARQARPARFWLPEDVLKYLTKIYGRFTNPFRSPTKRRR